MVGPAFGIETEYSLALSPGRKGSPPPLPGEDLHCIARMLKFLYDLDLNFGVVPFDHQRPEKTPQLVLPCLSVPTSAEKRFLRVLLTAGMLAPTLGRIYKELLGPYLEVSTRICTDPFELCRAVKRGEILAGFLARSISTPELNVCCLNTVSDRKGLRAESCGMHSNYLGSRDLYEKIFPPKKSYGSDLGQFPVPAQDLLSWLVLRIILTGEGKVGADHGCRPAVYQISARSDFVERLLGEQTAHRRPIINIKDEPHADWVRFARLHIINGEGNRSPWPIFFDVGITSIVLMALEDKGALKLAWYLADPVKTLHDLSRDLRLKQEIAVVERSTGKIVSKKPLELLGDILQKLKIYCCGASVPDWCFEVLERAERVRAAFCADDWEETGKMLDWVIKKRFIEYLMVKKLNLSPDDPKSWQHPKVLSFDFQYHWLDNDLAWRAASNYSDLEEDGRFSIAYDDPAQLDFWTQDPPKTTRSHLRWFLATHPYWKNKFEVLNWAKIGLQQPDGKQTNIFLGDPCQFGEKHLQLLIGNRGDFTKPENARFFIDALVRETRR